MTSLSQLFLSRINQRRNDGKAIDFLLDVYYEGSSVYVYDYMQNMIGKIANENVHVNKRNDDERSIWNENSDEMLKNVNQIDDNKKTNYNQMDNRKKMLISETDERMSILLNNIKRKFFETDLSLVKFVNSYASLSRDVSVHNLIHIKSFTVLLQETQNWDQIVNYLDKKNELKVGDYNIKDFVTALTRLEKSFETAVITKKEETFVIDIIKNFDALKSLYNFDTGYSIYLQYKYHARVKIKIELENVFSQSIDMALNRINDFRSNHMNNSFIQEITFEHILNSKDPQSKFINIILFTKESNDIFSVNPITVNNFGGIYGNKADRLSSDAFFTNKNAEYQKRVYPNTIIQARPTSINMMTKSVEWQDMLNYFLKVRVSGNQLIHGKSPQNKIPNSNVDLTNRMYFLK